MAESHSRPDAARSSSYLLSMPSNDDASNANRLRMLLAEIDSAASKMALAKISRDPKTVQQCKEYVLQTYQTGMHRILDTSLSDQEEQEVWNRLPPIGHWLEASGLLKD